MMPNPRAQGSFLEQSHHEHGVSIKMQRPRDSDSDVQWPCIVAPVDALAASCPQGKGLLSGVLRTGTDRNSAWSSFCPCLC